MEIVVENSCDCIIFYCTFYFCIQYINSETLYIRAYIYDIYVKFVFFVVSKFVFQILSIRVMFFTYLIGVWLKFQCLNQNTIINQTNIYL